MAGAKRIVGSQGKPYRTAHLGHLYDDVYIGIISQSGTSILLGRQHAHDTELSHRFEGIDGEELRPISFHHVWADVFMYEFAYHLPHHLSIFVAHYIDRKSTRLNS